MSTAELSSLQAILEGGPASILPASRIQEVSPFQEKVKLPHWGGYEHFERVGDLGDASSRQIAFRWTMRTEIAE